ncbi:SDR family NAD(P)-dependent oxidoreductase [Deinococcus hopiensis]|uniref:SDR family NAD(P)-dependent oxidoreductase n=1 Tax=Deinococcus hopiensis TaxID=309885 RepID=UPI001FEB836E|nr:SDR family NAD(P)-dependent oxidoreductase [Deinococcus hopiensis]
MHPRILDIEEPGAIQRFTAEQLRAFPALNVVIHNAGIVRGENLRAGPLEVAEATIATNLLGPIRLNAALLPHLLTQPRGTVLAVSSGIAFAPKAGNPGYGATKAAIHPYTQALRHQLRDTQVQVIELIPPFVQTELQGPAQATNPHALALADYIRETVEILSSTPDVTEVIVERVKPQRCAEARGEYGTVFQQYSERAAITKL